MEPEELENLVNSKIAQTAWSEISSKHEEGKVFLIDKDVSLVEIGKAAMEDNSFDVKKFIDDGLIVVPLKDETEAWASHSNLVFNFIEVSPFIFIKPNWE